MAGPIRLILVARCHRATSFPQSWTLCYQSPSLPVMRVIRHTDQNYLDRLQELTAPSSLFDPVIEGRTREILEAVRERGDAAVLEFTNRFDGAALSADQLPVTKAE